MAYADYQDLMKLTEDLLSKMVYSIKGTYIIDGTDEDGNPVKMNF